MFDRVSDIVGVLIAIILLVIIWRLTKFSLRYDNRLILIPAIKNRKNGKSSVTYDNKIDQTNQTNQVYQTDQTDIQILREHPRSTIIRQPFPVGEPALPLYNPTFITQEELYHRYGDHLPFLNPPPPSGPSSCGYGPPEVPAATGYRA